MIDNSFCTFLLGQIKKILNTCRIKLQANFIPEAFLTRRERKNKNCTQHADNQNMNVKKPFIQDRSGMTKTFL